MACDVFEMAWTALIQRFENTIQPTISRGLKMPMSVA
jgi:hypothetical protein